MAISLRKGALMLAFSLATLTGVKAQNNQDHNGPLPRMDAIEQIDTTKPWAKDPNYVREYEYLDDQAEIEIRLAARQYEENMKKISHRESGRTIGSIINVLGSSDKKRTGTREAGRVLQRGANNNAAKESIKENYDRRLLTIQRNYNNKIRSLDTKYQREYERNGQASTNTVNLTEKKMDVTFEQARQKLYKDYVNKEVKEGRMPQSPDDFFKSLEKPTNKNNGPGGM